MDTNSDNLKQIVREILEQGTFMSLGTVDEGGVWVSDVLYVSDNDLNIYWVSYSDTRHSNAIHQRGKVAAAITINDNAAGNKMGVQVSGIARKIDTEVKEIADKHRRKRGQNPLPSSGNMLDNYESWYMLRPLSIDIINEKLFGHHKKKLILNTE